MSRRLNWKLHWTEGLLPSHLWLPFQLFCTSHSLSFSQWDVQKPDLTSMSTLGRRASHRQRSPGGSRARNVAAGKSKGDTQDGPAADHHTGSRPPVMPSPGHSCDISKPSLRCRPPKRQHCGLNFESQYCSLHSDAKGGPFRLCVFPLCLSYKNIGIKTTKRLLRFSNKLHSLKWAIAVNMHFLKGWVSST